MIYDIRHVTKYLYEFPVSSAALSLRLTPRSGGGQRCLDHSLLIEPRPKALRSEQDFFGNVVTTATIETGLTALKIEARARVDVSRSVVVPPGASLAWKEIAAAALEQTSLGADAPVHFLFASPHITLPAPVTAYAAESFPPGLPVVDGARDLARRICADFIYSPQVTDVSTPLDDAFAQRRGVCQDFAHIMIAGLRGLGLPAAYVSGYIRTISPEGQPRLEGADATHAWVSIWCGEGTGWLGIDPTNAMDAGDDHIVLAIGRDFSDVSPVHGVFVGSGAHQLEVAVDVTPAGATA
ncbi:transglutaminase family protein [Bradyrhizobium sp. LHD-71]|uniref:transglutaminase family protein n=1 Tax=Bradyrhizobium sp. LHD-71 TaxID=3072141 RepID=UPI00280FEC4B|nr:transglutaminase family protein [Bradyrhizobium sp. LHD-71]MDQ8730981.1 transglutaminase family protein [Bradyrhizobium sp. LHD-71]